MAKRYINYDKNLKKSTWDNPNKMHIDTGHKAFDRQTNLITTGNVISNTQLSSYIHPYNEAKNPVGEKVSKGAMQDWDLQWFKNIPSHVEDAIRKSAKTKSVILYEFHHYNGRQKVVDGYVLTTPERKLIGKWSSSPKYSKIIEEAAKYVALPERSKLSPEDHKKHKLKDVS